MCEWTVKLMSKGMVYTEEATALMASYVVIAIARTVSAPVSGMGRPPDFTAMPHR